MVDFHEIKKQVEYEVSVVGYILNIFHLSILLGC